MEEIRESAILPKLVLPMMAQRVEKNSQPGFNLDSGWRWIFLMGLPEDADWS
jgi:hypothetical protein